MTPTWRVVHPLSAMRRPRFQYKNVPLTRLEILAFENSCRQIDFSFLTNSTAIGNFDDGKNQLPLI